MGMDYDKSKKRKREEFDKDPAAEGDPQTTVTVHVRGAPTINGHLTLTFQPLSFRAVKDKVLKKPLYLCWPPRVPCIRSMVSLGLNLDEDEMTWLSICKHVRFREEAHEENMCTEDYYKTPVSIVNRPKNVHAPLPFATDLGIHGQFTLCDVRNASLPVSRIGFAASVETSASVILLALNDDIWKDLVSLNSKCDYLVVRVSWDKLSYIFLRTLRKSYPDIPIVGVTDLDPHHLDLLTFLDTPPESLPTCYGWDLSRDFEVVGASYIHFLNIRWLGLMPADLVRKIALVGNARRCAPPGFDEVIRMLRVNPYLRRRESWLDALDWLHVFRKSVVLHPPASKVSGVCHVHLGDDFISKKLYEKDWV